MEKVILISTFKPNFKKAKSFSRIYFGSEFCQHLLPTPQITEKFIKEFPNKNISLLTPIVNEDGLKQIDILISLFQKQNKSFEVIVNDFGVLNLIHTKYPNCEPVLGRIISNNIFTFKKNLYLQNKNTLKMLHNQYHVNRIEFDKNIENIEIPQHFLKNIHFTIYFPYLFMTTTKRCLFPHLLSPKRNKYETYSCNQECLKTKQKFIISYPMIKEKIYVVGNTHFIKNKELKFNRKCTNIDRLVYDKPF